MKIYNTSRVDFNSLTVSIKEALPESPSFILYFHSVQHDATKIAEMFASLYPGVTAIGCTTSGEIATQQMFDGGLVVAGFDKEEVVLAKAEEIVKGDVKAAYARLIAQFKDPQFSTHVGFILMDGLSGQEENIMESLGECTDLTFIGGSAGDDLKFSKTYVALNGKVVKSPGVIALIHVPAGFDVIKTQSFTTTDRVLTPTKVHRETRSVIEFNHKPAAVAYAEAVGAASADAVSNFFMSNPLGLMAGDEPFVRSPQRVEGNTMYFYCNVHEGIDLTVLKGQDIVGDTRKALAASNFRSLVVFNCILRTLDLKNQGKQDAFGQLFTVPTIGFSTYGEAYIGHINQTATILALK